jgi:hypothetical protein
LIEAPPALPAALPHADSPELTLGILRNAGTIVPIPAASDPKTRPALPIGRVFAEMCRRAWYDLAVNVTPNSRQTFAANPQVLWNK